MARILWRQMGVKTEDTQWRGSLKIWLAHNFRGDSTVEGEVGSRIFTITCWWLWKWRNERSFNASPKIPVDQLSFVFARLKQIEFAMRNTDNLQNAPRNPRVEEYIRWRHSGGRLGQIEY